MANPYFDRERAIKILVDAEVLGVSKAAKRWGVTTQTVRNHRKRLASDTDYLEALAARQRDAALHRQRCEDGWRLERARSLRKALRKANELLASETDLNKVTNFLDRIGGLDIQSEALNGAAEPDRDGAEAAQDAPEPAGVTRQEPETEQVH